MIEDFARGLTFYSTGGGGNCQRGIELLLDQLEKGHEIGWVDVDELKDDEYSCCPYLVGSLATPDEETKRWMKNKFGLDDAFIDDTARMVRGIKAMEEKMGKKISALIPVELGGATAGACLSAAAELGLIVPDGDYTGRSMPEIQQTTPYIFDQTITPTFICDGWGDLTLIEGTINYQMAERIAKQIAIAGFACCSQTGFFANGADTKKALVKGTLTESYEAGKALREAVEAGLDPADVIAEKVGGWVVCKGKVTGKEVEPRDDYYCATHEITGEGDYAGTNLKIWLENENHICWRNGEILATTPDMIQVIDSKTGQPYTNNIIETGMNVSVIVMKSRDVFRTERGLFFHNPRTFGFDVDYVPVEERLN